MKDSDMTSNHPYLIRALYQWIADNDLTPHLLVDASVQGVSVPPHSVQNGKVVLNISPSAVRELDLGNEWVHCETRFNGRSQRIELPTEAVIAIYARENGQGMMFAEAGNEPPDGPSGSGDDDDSPTKGSHLKVVK